MPSCKFINLTHDWKIVYVYWDLTNLHDSTSYDKRATIIKICARSWITLRQFIQTPSLVYDYDSVNYAEPYHFFLIINFVLHNENYLFHRILFLK